MTTQYQHPEFPDMTQDQFIDLNRRTAQLYDMPFNENEIRNSLQNLGIDYD